MLRSLSLICAFALGISAAFFVGPFETIAHAQQTTTTRSAPSEAVSLYEQAHREYQAGRYVEAAEMLERALVLDPGSPALFYNLARVYELATNYRDALRVYQDLLAVTPASDASGRADTQAAIRRVQGALASRPPSATEVQESQSEVFSANGPTFTRQSGVADEWFWAAGTAGLVALVGAAACGVAAVLENGRAQNFVVGRDGEIEGFDNIVASSRNFALAADIAGVSSAVLLGTALVLFVARDRTVEVWQEAPTASLSVSVSPSYAGVTVRGVF